METLFLVGRLILGMYYLLNGLNHFWRRDRVSAYAASKGVPMPKVLTIVTGILLVIGGTSILLGIYPEVGVAALALFYIPVTFWMHAFWSAEDPSREMVEVVNFTKNLALLGAALMLLAVPQPWPMSLGR